VTRATAASGTHTAASGMAATTSMPAAATAAGMPSAASMPTTMPAATAAMPAAFRGGGVGRSRQRRRKNKDGNPEFEFRHDVARSVGTFVVRICSPNVLKWRQLEQGCIDKDQQCPPPDIIRWPYAMDFLLERSWWIARPPSRRSNSFLETP
jgi:hypothetical protein